MLQVIRKGCLVLLVAVFLLWGVAAFAGETIRVSVDSYGNQHDCNDNNSAINLGASEVKHDGIDQDCNGYDLTIDITRADYMAAKKNNPGSLEVLAITDPQQPRGRLRRDGLLRRCGAGISNCGGAEAGQRRLPGEPGPGRRDHAGEGRPSGQGAVM